MKYHNFRTFLNPLVQINKKSLKLKYLLRILCKWLLLLQPNSNSSQRLKRFIDANQLPVSPIEFSSNNPTIDILYVATIKDFDVLISTISTTLRSLENYKINCVTIIVPDAHSYILKELLALSGIVTRVIPESTFVSNFQINALKERFGDRYGWALQQILKISYVKQSKSAGVMVVDADTALLHKRNWLDASGKQVLCPTWENHSSYYKFLEELGVGFNPPKFTFVSHHMLFQPIILNQILTSLGWNSNEKLINELISASFIDEVSPFSIDYELYAQYLYLVHPDKVVLEKWSNFEAHDRNASENLKDYVERFVSKCIGKYASVSFHSYRNQSPIIDA